MAKKKFQIKSFDKYLLRTPVLPVSAYLDLTSGFKIEDENLIAFYEQPYFNEAIFLASPVLHSEIGKWIKGELTDAKKINNLKTSLLKYISRTSSRSTPFGLFSGCSIGKFSYQTNITIGDLEGHERTTRLDIEYLMALLSELTQQKEVKEQLDYYPNSSLYKVGNGLRYIEYNYVNGKRKYQVTSINCSDYLFEIIMKCDEGISFSDIVDLFVSDDVTKEESLSFVNLLIDSQVLVNELEPSISGTDMLEQMIQKLQRLNKTDYIVEKLIELRKCLNLIDFNKKNTSETYSKIRAILESLKVDFNGKYLYQTDTYIKTINNTLNRRQLNIIYKGAKFFNRVLKSNHKNPSLDNFKEKFFSRYENEEIPLLLALDPETGIGYSKDQDAAIPSELIDNLILPQKKGMFNGISLNEINVILLKKLLSIDKSNQSAKVIRLYDNDFENLNSNWDGIPQTFSFLTQLIYSGNDIMAMMKPIGMASGASLISRFCHIDTKIMNYFRNIIDKEESNDKILAEIIHLPESRAGNILSRPNFRKHEIPVLSSSLTIRTDQIQLEDLMISLKNNGKYIYLRSKKFDKEIIPRLTTAHNYFSDSLLIYNFLCDLQNQNMNFFNGNIWGAFRDVPAFLPRIVYENIIISLAQWNIETKDVKHLTNIKNDDISLMNEITLWREKNDLPDLVYLIESDNKLLINLKNVSSIKMFLSSLKKFERISLTEFLYNQDSCVKNENGESFVNEFLFSFYKEDMD